MAVNLATSAHVAPARPSLVAAAKTRQVARLRASPALEPQLKFGNTRTRARLSSCVRVHCEKQSSEPERSGEPDPGPLLKAVWYGAEQFGNLVGLKKQVEGKGTEGGGEGAGAVDGADVVLAREEALELLRADYDCNYFVSGAGDMAAYVDQCTFADPFVSFKGVQRFKKNVSNLGGLMEDIDLEITGWEEREAELETSWRFSCVLSLPWRPRLAAAGGTTHVFDPASGRVVEHIERWDVEPGKVVQQLLKPSPRPKQ